MKRMKRIAVLVLAMALVLSLGVAAFADETATGSITINSNTTVSVATKTFNAYKILDVKAYTSDSVVYTVPEALKSFYKDRYELTGDEADFDAQVVEKIKAETDIFDFAAAALAAAKTAGIEPGEATAGESATSVTISGLPLGYYVVEDAGTKTPISALMLDTTTPNISLTIKADEPAIDKNIDGDKDTDDSTEGTVKYNNAAVGDTVPYVVTSAVPDMTGYTKYYFVVSDTMSKGLTFNDDVTITIGEETTLTKDTDYTVTATKNGDGTTAVEIVFKNFIDYEGNKGQAITINYSATVNSDAVIGVAGNNNEVKLTYSNNPNVKDDGDSDNPDKPTSDSPVGETPEAVTRTYVTAVELTKVDGQGKRLTGAEFEITGTKLNTVLVRTDVFAEDANGTYWKLKDGSYTTTDPATLEDQTAYESTTIKYTKTVQTTPITKTENVSYTATVGADGVLRFEGLAAGKYTITEIKAPAGYNLLKDSIDITITWTAPEAPATDCTWAVTGSGATVVDGIVKLTVVNQAGSELPSTGGMGTTVFYILGSVLVLAAVVLLVTRKRMSSRG